MAIRKRGNSYLVDVKVGPTDNPTGKAVRERVTCAGTEADAKKLEAQVRLGIMQHGRYEPALAKASRGRNTLASIDDAIRAAWEHPTKGWAGMRDGARQRRRAEICAEIIGKSTPVKDIDRSTFDKLAKIFAERDRNGPDNVRLKLQALYRVLWFAERKGWITARPSWDRPDATEPRDFVFSEQVEADVISYFRRTGLDDMADLFALGMDTGCRLNELLTLRPENLNLAEQTIMIRNSAATGQRTKSKKSRAVVIVDERSVEVLKVRAEANPDGPTMWPGWSKAKVASRMREVRAMLGFKDEKGFTFHGTRHTHLTRLAGHVPLFALMDQAGHETPSITRRYVKMNDTLRRKLILRQTTAPMAEDGDRLS